MGNDLMVQNDSPAELIKLAISGNADLEKLEKLLALQERWEANEARKAYNEAMTSFKANPPKINKDRKVNYRTTNGVMNYNHASLANCADKITAELSKYGLSASWTTQQETNGLIKVTCKIIHNKGHFEITSLQASADNSGSKNSIQAIGSTVSYLERYTLLALTGLATYDMDNDGLPNQGSNNNPPPPPQEKKKEDKQDKVVDTAETKNLRVEIGKMLMEMAGNDVGNAALILEGITKWEYQGKEYSYKTIDAISEKSLKTNYGKVKTKYEDWKKSND